MQNVLFRFYQEMRGSVENKDIKGVFVLSIVKQLIIVFFVIMRILGDIFVSLLNLYCDI